MRRFRLRSIAGGVILVITIATYFSISSLPPRKLQNTSEYISRLNEKIDALERKLNNLSGNKQPENEDDQNYDAVNIENNYDNILGSPSERSGVIPVLVFSCNRPTVTRAIDSILRARGSSQQNIQRFPLIVSQDCGHLETSKAIQKYSGSLTHIKQPDLSDPPRIGKSKSSIGYAKIARHYKWALNQIFNIMKFETGVIILEDDLEVSLDIFSYFNATFPLLNSDKSLMCVSAWNDNGKPGNINGSAASKLWRSDFFPGLGWMITKETALEWLPKWPPGYWDDWIRQREQRRNRQCIRPEISRTSTFGQIGTSSGQFFNEHLKYISHYSGNYDFEKIDLSYLTKANYEAKFEQELVKASPIKLSELKALTPSRKAEIAANGNAVRIIYNGTNEFERIAKAMGLMSDTKEGVPRTAYRGVVSIMYNNVRVHLAPAPGGRGY